MCKRLCKDHRIAPVKGNVDDAVRGMGNIREMTREAHGTLMAAGNNAKTSPAWKNVRESIGDGGKPAEITTIPEMIGMDRVIRRAAAMKQMTGAFRLGPHQDCTLVVKPQVRSDQLYHIGQDLVVAYQSAKRLSPIE